MPEDRTYGVFRLLDCKHKKIISIDGSNRQYFENASWCVISHCWDEQQINRSFDIPGITWDVHMSCNKIDTICNIVLQTGYDYCWIDNLCIDQSNDKEKSVAIPAMSSIYGNNNCIAMLRSSDVWGQIDKLRYLTAHDDRIHTLDTAGKNNLSHCASILERVFTDRWFTRVWTTQECVLPKTMFFSTYDCTVIPRDIKSRSSLERPCDTGRYRKF